MNDNNIRRVDMRVRYTRLRSDRQADAIFLSVTSFFLLIRRRNILHRIFALAAHTLNLRAQFFHWPP